MNNWLLLAGVLAFSACNKEDDTVPSYALELATSGSGTASVDPDQENYMAGTEVTLIATADADWEFAGWSGDITSTNNPLALTMDGNKLVVAEFSQIPSYAITIIKIGNGSVATSPEQATYQRDSQIALTATADEGWEFSGWSGDITSTDNPLKVTVDQAKSLTAIFSELTVYRAANGVTIKASADAVVGENYQLEGETYTVVDNALLKAIGTNGDYTKVITTKVTDMSGLFFENSSFNQDVSSWDVSNVISMSNMFYKARAFNQDISKWDVSKVTDMSSTFNYAENFNQAIGSWDVNNVVNMSYMFRYARTFNQAIGSWDVSSVEDMNSMFYSAGNFNQDLGGWDVSSVTDMQRVFAFAGSFNQNIGNWNVSAVTNMSTMFHYADSFNQDIGAWDVSKVTDMTYLFYHAIAFNQDLSGWDVSNVSFCSPFADGADAWLTEYRPNLTCN